MEITKIASETSISWQLDGIAMDATLTRPLGDGSFPAVIMVAGSGPTDRNWNSPLLPGTNGSAALLAGVLTKRGFVTLRYDKRASGPHGKENAMKLAGRVSMQSHVEELAGGVAYLVDQSFVDNQKIFALANSEGCIHALNYQLQENKPAFAGLILTAPPARPVGLVAHEQLAAQLDPIPGGDKWLASYDSAIDDFIAGREVKVDESLPEGVKNLLMGTTKPVNQPFVRELWTIDPARLLSKIDVPVLVVIGKKDLQVNWQADGSIIEAISKTHKNIKIVYPENANHVLKYEARQRSQLTAANVAASYNADTSVLDEETVTAITSWLALQQ
jgi:pimeloyl-ACP methyl ester carboxylesterase